MREMKDSGIEWIGEIPADWAKTRIGNLFRFSSGDSLTNEEIQDEGLYKVYGANGPRGYYHHTNIAGKHILIGRVGALCGNIHVVDEPVWVTEHALIAEQISPGVLTDFAARVFESMNLGQYSKASAQPVIASSVVQRLQIPIPPSLEQRRIADYLDRKCSQIDAIIARQQEVIEKLKAYKLAVITEVVTKGLNPDVPMNDSGVEWIGEIPEHWDFRRIKNCCLIVDCKNRTPDPNPDGEYIVVRTTCIRDGSFSYEGSYHTNAENFKEWTAKGQPQHGDIFFTREAPMGEACLVPDTDNLCMGQRVMFFRPLDGSDPRYILYSIYGPLAREYIDSKNKGSTVGHLKLGQVASLPLFYCPPREQSEIANYLDKRCGAIDKVVEKKAEIISRITDYKKSLIYEVVTGKKEV